MNRSQRRALKSNNKYAKQIRNSSRKGKTDIKSILNVIQMQVEAE